MKPCSCTERRQYAHSECIIGQITNLEDLKCEACGVKYKIDGRGTKIWIFVGLAFTNAVFYGFLTFVLFRDKEVGDFAFTLAIVSFATAAALYLLRERWLIVREFKAPSSSSSRPTTTTAAASKSLPSSSSTTSAAATAATEQPLQPTAPLPLASVSTPVVSYSNHRRHHHHHHRVPVPSSGWPIGWSWSNSNNNSSGGNDDDDDATVRLTIGSRTSPPPVYFSRLPPPPPNEPPPPYSPPRERKLF